MIKKTVWLNVSIELLVDDGVVDESVMDYANDLAVEAGFTVDDMGMINPTDTDKFYPEENK